MSSENIIKRLPPAVAERIAAGEVIERPASVVKELVENSLDAGATEISIRLDDGGKSLIEVMDNGRGMSPSDLALSIERHATSKLTSLDDLDRIATLGFRGEALPSVAAVSEVSILSRTREGDSAYELVAGDVADRGITPLQAQKVTFGHFCNSSHGTRIQARGLFSQVPARLKFLKSQAAEVAQVREWVERLALAYPQVGFQVYSGDRRLVNLRPQSELERVQEILGEGEEFPVILAETEQDSFKNRGLKMRLYWLQGLSSPQSRRLVQIVNSRSLRDRFLQQAMMAPFKQSLLPGQYPALALFVEINPAAIDVNVHPTKAEVRFLDKGKIFTSLDSLVKSMIAQKGAPARVPLSKTYEAAHSPTSLQESSDPLHRAFPTALRSQPSDFRRPVGSYSEVRDAAPPANHWAAAASALRVVESSDSGSQAQDTEEKPTAALTIAVTSPEPFSFSTTLQEEPTETQIEPEFKPLALEFPQPAMPLALSGPPSTILFHTYLVYEDRSELVLIDQHAAHERIRYEKIKRRLSNNSAMSAKASQALLIPETVRLRQAEGSQAQLRFGLLEKLGFEAEIFGEDTVLFRAIPTEWGHRNLKVRLKNLIEKLLEVDLPNGAATPADLSLLDETLFESIASEACHSAVRAGDSLTLAEAQQLTRDLFQCEHPWNCPHGRPTVVRVPMRKLEEWFQRKL